MSGRIYSTGDTIPGIGVFQGIVIQELAGARLRIKDEVGNTKNYSYVRVQRLVREHEASRENLNATN